MPQVRVGSPYRDVPAQDALLRCSSLPWSDGTVVFLYQEEELPPPPPPPPSPPPPLAWQTTPPAAAAAFDPPAPNPPARCAHTRHCFWGCGGAGGPNRHLY